MKLLETRREINVLMCRKYGEKKSKHLRNLFFKRLSFLNMRWLVRPDKFSARHHLTIEVRKWAAIQISQRGIYSALSETSESMLQSIQSNWNKCKNRFQTRFYPIANNNLTVHHHPPTKITNLCL